MQLSSSSTRSRDLPPQLRDRLHPSLLGTAGHVTGEEGHLTSLTRWRAACDISARSFGLLTNYEQPIMKHRRCCARRAMRLFSCFAAARAACVSTRLGESDKGEVTRGALWNQKPKKVIRVRNQRWKLPRQILSLKYKYDQL